MKTLITGGAGFIGSWVAEELLLRGHEVDILDDMSGGFWRNVPERATHFLLPRCECSSCDYARSEERRQFLKDNPEAATEDAWEGVDERPIGCARMELIDAELTWDVVIHAAADATEGRSQFTPNHCTCNGLSASVAVFTEAIKRGAKRIVFLSSMAVYGHGPDGRRYDKYSVDRRIPFRDTDVPQPCDVYGANKAAAEVCLRALCEAHGVEWTIIRPHNVFGPRQNMSDPYRNVVAIFMRQLLEGKPITVYGDGQQTRQFSPVGPVAEAICNAATWPSWGYETNVGSDHHMTVNELAAAVTLIASGAGPPWGADAWIKRLNMLPKLVMYAPDRPCEVKHAFCNNFPARSLCGMPPTGKAEVEAALVEMWEWAKALHEGDGFAEPRKMALEIDSEAAPAAWRQQPDG